MEKIKNFLKIFIFSIVLFIIVFFIIRPYEDEDFQERIKYYSDCFTVVGGLLACFGALTFSSKYGAFDGLSYMSKSIFAKFIPSFSTQDNYENYKFEKERTRKGINYPLLLIGFLYLLVGLIISFFY